MKKLIIAATAIGLSSAAFAQASAPTFAQVDADGSGGVTLTELQAVWPELTAEAVATADANADGQLDQAEFDAWIATLPTQ